MTERQRVQETIFNGSKYEGDGWPPEDPAGFLAWFQERIERIPPEHRANTKIEFGSQGGYYGDHSASLEITYLRDETNAEVEARLQREARERAKTANREKQILQNLLRKYGAP